MKSFGDILIELGFNPNAPEAVQKAFFQHLANHAAGLEKRTPPPDQGPANKPIQQKNEQLTMDFDAVGSIDCIRNNKKVS